MLSKEDSGLDEEKPVLDLGNTLDLSLNSLIGITLSHTMKVRGSLGAREVVILIDSRASHSFIASKLMQELKLPCEDTIGWVS